MLKCKMLAGAKKLVKLVSESNNYALIFPVLPGLIFPLTIALFSFSKEKPSKRQGGICYRISQPTQTSQNMATAMVGPII